ncbi:MAG: hypothetical protein GY854_08725, partial [Deltaproteobacteria bacterium]|nr:hypothetical protein [Deltaproteobacteria bacterium]
MKNAIAIAALLATVTCLGAAGADKEVPPYIPVQGYLTEQATGNPIDNPSVIIRFSLWDEEAAGTGYELWSELYDGASAVSVVDGFFTVYLGMINSLYYEKLMYYSADISGIDPLLVGEPIDNLWLEIQAGLDAPMDRVQLASVPFAQEAQYCHQIGDVTEDDVQSKLDFYCGGSLFLRGWADGGPICEVDKQSDMGDAGVSVGVLLVSAGPGLELTPESTNDMPILRAAFGSTSGTTAEGNHLHDDDYQPLMDTQCPTGQVIHEIYPNGNVSCTPDNVGLITSVAAPLVATGGYLTLDQTGIQPRLSASICGAGDFITSIDPATGAAVCSTPVGKVYTAPAGGGVLINGSDEISADFDYVQARVNIGGNTADGTCGVGELMKGIDPASGAITCAADQTTGSSGGEIVSVTGISPIETEDDGLGHVDVSIKVGEGAGSVAPDDHSHTEFGTFALYTESITSIQGCVDGQVLKSTGGVWDCDNDINTNTNADTICTAGAGYYLDGSGACNPINFETYQTRIGTHDCVDNGIKRIDPATGVVTCADAYADGEGLSLTGHTFNVTFGDTAGTVAEGSHGHAGYAAEVHEHDWGNITSGMPGGFADGVDNVDDTVIWSEISGIVGTGASEVAQGSHGHAGYSTTGHEHAWGEITGMPAGFSDGVDDVNDSVAWSEISGIVGTGTSQVAQGSHGHAGYSTTGHEHAWGEITGMPGGFSDGVDDVDDTVVWSEISGIVGTTTSSVAQGSHNHDSDYNSCADCESTFVNKIGDSMTGELIISENMGSGIDNTPLQAINTSGSTAVGAVYGAIDNAISGQAIYGNADVATGSVHGVYGRTAASSGRAIYGNATSTTGNTYGVYGEAISTAGRAGLFHASATSGTNYGIWTQTESTSGTAIRAVA